MVAWLTAKGKARNSSEALMLALGLMNEGYLQPASELSKEAAERGEQSAFLDDTNALYYFVMAHDDSIFDSRQISKAHCANRVCRRVSVCLCALLGGRWTVGSSAKAIPVMKMC